MAGAGAGRSLEQTPTWAVAVVCFVLVAISIFIEHIIHVIGEWLKSKHKRALYEALEKVKSELMLLGFLSLLLTVGQGPISNICISKKLGATWHPCSLEQEEKVYGSSQNLGEELRRKLLVNNDFRRVLAAAGYDKCAYKGKVPFVSAEAIHQLHIFIFVLAISHVLYCILTLALGRAKMKSWKEWENDSRTIEYQFSHDPERFMFTRQTSFGRRHLSFWSKTPVLIWIVCFFRQFVRSVPKIDYLTLRHGFVVAHLAPQSHAKFDFRKYINRSLEEDFKVVVGISPPIWLFAVLFLLFNTHGWHSYLWLPFIPLIIILIVGTKLQVIITKMGLRIQEHGEVVKGLPVVQPGDELFWFSRPRLTLYLINFVLFQNSFQLAFFAWSWYEYGLRSCFHKQVEDIVIRISMGILIQIMCSYVTLPLYALVTQMGSSMNPTILNEQVATALKNWHQTAKKHIKQSNNSTTKPSLSGGMSPLHLLPRHHHNISEIDSPRIPSPMSNYNINTWEIEESASPTRVHEGDSSSTQQIELSHHFRPQGEIHTALPRDFSFAKTGRT